MRRDDAWLLDTVWQTVLNDLPPLIAQLEPLIPPEPE